MKLLLTALCASFMVTSASFAAECEKGKCDKEKKEEGTVLAADCDKCKKGDEKKEEGTFFADSEKGKCDKEKCDKDKKEEGTLAHCGKCGKDDKHKEGDEKKEGDDKKEGTLA